MKVAIFAVLAALVAVMMAAPKGEPASDRHVADALMTPITQDASLPNNEPALRQVLNQKTMEAMGVFDEQDKMLFSKSDIAWHVYVEETCRLQGHEFKDTHGTGETAARAACAVDKLRARIHDVNVLIAHNTK